MQGILNRSALGLGARISLINFGLVIVAFTAFIIAVMHVMSGLVESQANEGVTERTRTVSALLEASDRDVRQRATELSNLFRSRLPGDFQLDPTPVDIAGRMAPSLLLDGHLLDNDSSVVDSFTAATGGVATIFAKSGDDFVRVTTSLKNDKGQRVVGTLLDRKHPGYKATLDGGSYVGLALLFGRQYMTHYDPIKDHNGKVVGLLFVGLDFDGYLTEVKSAIRKMKIGDTGYFYILDAHDGANHGHMVVHPTGEGDDFTDMKDASGFPVIKAILDRKDGVIRYPWINKELGETSPRYKVVSFTYLKGWDWIVAGGTYVDEYTTEVRHLRNLFALLGAVIVLLAGGVTYWLLRRMVTQPLARVVSAAEQVARGDLSVRLMAQRPDEIGKLVEAMNTIGSDLTRVVGTVRQGA